MVRATAIWHQLGTDPIKQTKKARVRVAAPREVRFTYLVSGDELYLHQAANGDCNVRVSIVDTFGAVR